MVKYTSLICAILTLLNSLLHLLLMFGAPLGEYVLGGQNVVFPPAMRLVSSFFFLFFLFMGLLYLKLGGFLNLPVHNKVMYVMIIIYTIFAVYAVFANLFMTDSIKETLVMTPVTAIESVCSILAITQIYRNRKT